MKGILAIAVIWIALLILLTGCYPIRTAIRCNPSDWANNRCADDQDRMAQGKGVSAPEPKARPDKPDHCPKRR